MRARFAVFILIIQAVLLWAHWFIYGTWVTFWGIQSSPELTWIRGITGALAFSFVAASLLAHRFRSRPVKIFYRAAAAWLGTVNFLFLAACVSWVFWTIASLTGIAVSRSNVVTFTYAIAIVASLYGIVNARWLRVRRIQVKLPNLPESWRGRVAALASDLHLGHVNGIRFLQRIVARLTRLAPDVVFLTGDLYDGTKVDPAEVTAPLRELAPPLGAYFVTGNHEEFSDPAGYLQAVHRWVGLVQA